MRYVLHFFEVNGQNYLYNPADNGIYACTADDREAFDHGKPLDPHNLLAMPRTTALGGRLPSGRDQSGTNMSLSQDGPQFLVKLPRFDFAAGDACRKLLGDGMTQLTLSVTECCDLRCRYCIYGGDGSVMRTHSALHMSWETGRDAVRYFLEHRNREKVPTISFYGGEPLLNPDLIMDLITFSKQCVAEGEKIHFSIATNGVALGAPKARKLLPFLMEHGVHFQISLDGDAFTHDMHRRTAVNLPTHASVVAAIHGILEIDRDYYKHLSFAATVAPPADVERVCKYFADFPIYRDLGLAEQPAVSISVATLAGTSMSATDEAIRWQESHHDKLESLRHEYVDACIHGRRDEVGPAVCGIFDVDMIMLYGRPRSNIANGFRFGGCCIPGVKKLFVTASGAYQACERVHGRCTIGDVQRGVQFEAVDEMHDLYTSQFGDRCQSCWAVRLCRLCYTSLVGPEVHDSVHERCCAIVTNRLHASLKSYVAIIEGTEHTPEFMLLPAAQGAGMPARRVRAQAMTANRPTEGIA